METTGDRAIQKIKKKKNKEGEKNIKEKEKARALAFVAHPPPRLFGLSARVFISVRSGTSKATKNLLLEERKKIERNLRSLEEFESPRAIGTDVSCR